MISAYEAPTAGPKSFGWRALVAALVLLAPFAPALERELGVVNDDRQFSFVTIRGLRYDPMRYAHISYDGGCLYSAFHHSFFSRCRHADYSRGVGEYACGVEPGRRPEIVYTENELSKFRPVPCCGSYRSSFNDCDWLSYWDCRYETPELSMAFVRTAARRSAWYPSEYHAEGRFVGSLAYSLLFDLLSR